jgi:asparagine synthase (glutamine-hydrolysing)
MLRTGGGRLAAFTSVPLADTGAYVGQRFGDEWPLAQVAAQFAGNVDLQAIPAAEVTPIQAIRRMLRIQGEPGHAAGNYHWMLALEQAAQDRGCRILLTGQMGNAGISWTGDVFSQPLAFQLRRMGWREWSKERVKRALPASVYAALQRARQGRRDWLRHTALRADVAARLNLMERRMNDAEAQPSRTPLEQRRWLRPGRSFIGALHAQMGAAHGLDVRDPTGDARVLAFTFSVPDWVFMDPASGLDRWLIRAAMQGRLPDDVRLNRRRGRQAGDLVPRLRACAAEVEAALDEIARGPGGGYVDVSRLRQAWAMIQAHDTPEAFQLAVTVLTRGVMAGLFVNEFDRSNG